MKELKKNIDKKITEPFPHAEIENFLNENDVNSLFENFPDKIFETYIDPTSINNDKPDRININDPQLINFFKKDKIWKKIINQFTDKEFVNNLIDYFKDDFEKFNLKFKLNKYHIYKSYYFSIILPKSLSQLLLKKLVFRYEKIKNIILRLLKIPSIRVELYLRRSYPGYNLKAHTDQRSKFIILLFYLHDMKDEEGNDISNLLLFKSKNNNKKDWVRHPKSENVEEVKTINVRKNKLFLSLNSKNSLHGIKKYHSKKFRKFLYLSLTISNYDNIWE